MKNTKLFTILMTLMLAFMSLTAAAPKASAEEMMGVITVDWSAAYNGYLQGHNDTDQVDPKCDVCFSRTLGYCQTWGDLASAEANSLYNSVNDVIANSSTLAGLYSAFGAFISMGIIDIETFWE